MIRFITRSSCVLGSHRTHRCHQLQRYGRANQHAQQSLYRAMHPWLTANPSLSALSCVKVPDPARVYPFELDAFQKEAIVHLERVRTTHRV